MITRRLGRESGNVVSRVIRGTWPRNDPLLVSGANLRMLAMCILKFEKDLGSDRLVFQPGLRELALESKNLSLLFPAFGGR